MGRRLIQGPVDRTGRHQIRSTILAAIAAALATIALVLAASGNSAVAASSLVNGNFETGNLTGWTVDTTASGGTASAVASYDYCSAESSLECGVIATMTPQEGSYFALLFPGTVSEDTMISQPFDASNGDKVGGWAFFRTGDYLPYDDKAQVVIKSASGTTVATPFEQSVSSVGQDGNSGWKNWEYTFSGLTGTGQFRIEARIHNTGDSGGTSAIGLDGVKTHTLGSDTTKPSTSATRSVEPNAAGWNKANVTVRLNATDEGGSGVDKITYSASDKDGNVEDKKSLTVKIDKAAPTVKKTSPANGATRVSTSAKISATFLEEGSGIDPNTLTTDTFKVVQVTMDRVKGYVFVPVKGTISYDEASKTVTFTPSSPLRAKATYSATIVGYGEPPRVEDKADNVLREGFDYAWSFSTGGTLCCGM